ncbi:hypothetical protein V1517DRAFT_328234 [Lipomyces orientalis]|uniref:Uncharacterized protein n=1 Tax=Lipomyces orientalis TaxID=1233043 RepID=A0ACC3TI32_9ASCO
MSVFFHIPLRASSCPIQCVSLNAQLLKVQYSLLRQHHRSGYLSFHLWTILSKYGYRSCGLCPVSIGEIFSRGRYRVFHKLDIGRCSTSRLARDQLCHLVVL